MKFSAGIVQFDVRTGELELNMEHAFEGLCRLGEKRIGLAVLPEMWSCGFDHKNLKVHAAKTDAVLKKTAEIALKYNMIIAGSMPEIFEGNIYNTLYVINMDGTLSGSYRKIHLFSPTNEPRYFSKGTKAVVCETSLGRVGLMTCYDLRFPELCRSLALQDAKIIIISAQWPSARIGHWNALIKARAIENQIFIVAANRCGNDKYIKFGGCSQIVSPWGNLAAISKDKPCILKAEINLREISEFRNTVPCLSERVPKAYVIKDR